MSRFVALCATSFASRPDALPAHRTQQCFEGLSGTFFHRASEVGSKALPPCETRGQRQSSPCCENSSGQRLGHQRPCTRDVGAQRALHGSSSQGRCKACCAHGELWAHGHPHCVACHMKIRDARKDQSYHHRKKPGPLQASCVPVGCPEQVRLQHLLPRHVRWPARYEQHCNQ